ncbi:MAG: membrane-associated protease RseP (regulator of RpoE activity) [Ilumatobacter sp.]|jgi:membrane-associated protease RseP (regulator of RpoE activity)
MTDQLTPPTEDDATGRSKFASEVMAGGAVTENLADDELAGGRRGVLSMLAILGLFAWLGFANFWIFVFVVGVVISIFLHELGHYLTAKWSGMKVTQFFLFFGPRLWSFRRGETEYGVRALPLGAFVRIIGMNRMDEVEPGDESRAYRQKSFPRRLLVISAGSIMHILIAITLLFGVYSVAGEDTVRDGVEVKTLVDGGAAQSAGVLPGDIVRSVDGESFTGSNEFGELIRSNDPGDSITLTVLRNDVEESIPVVLGSNDAGGALVGVSSASIFETIDHSIPAAAGNAVADIVPFSWESAKGVVKVLNPVNIITHLTGSNDDMTSRPTTLVGVAAISDDVGDSSGWAGMLLLLAVLNVFVGVFNMFPLLPLDGGHAAIALYERVRERVRGGKQRYFADVERLMPFAMGVVTVLVMLMFAGLYLDVTKPL